MEERMEAIIYINPILSPDLGSLSIRSLLPDDALFWSITSAVAILFMAIALYLQRLQDHGWRWLHAAVADARIPVTFFATDVSPISGDPFYV
jgi:uncharacterized membrane protein YhaH (DUF805 family)